MEKVFVDDKVRTATVKENSITKIKLS